MTLVETDSMFENEGVIHVAKIILLKVLWAALLVRAKSC
jgi:hypothetical protein